KKRIGIVAWLAAAVVSAGSLPAAAIAPTTGISPSPSPLTQALTDGSGLDPAAEAALASYRQSRHAEEFLAAVLRAQETGSAHFVYSDPVHDVSGDTRADVLAVDTYLEYEFGSDVLSPTFTYETRVIVRALEGATGRVLWTKRAHFENGFMDIVEAKTGARGRNGFSLLIMDGALGPAEERRFTIRAVTGRGKRLWSRTYQTVVVERFPLTAYANVPVILGTFDAFEGPATDYLVGLGDLAYSGIGWVSDVGAVSIDGTGGTETTHLAREIGAGGDVPVPWPAGDLSGDGLDDYVFVNPHPQVAQGEEGQELGGVLRGRRGDDGTLIWERGGFDFGETITVWVYPVEDLAGNPRGDLLLAAWISDRARMQEGTDWDLYLVDGASGGPRWKRTGSWPYVPGDVDGDGADDVIARGVGTNARWTAADMRLWAYDATGKTLWRKTYRTRSDGPLTCSAGCSSFIGTGFGSAGDLQPDGIVDSYVMQHIGHRPGGDTFARYLVDGRTGRRSLVSGKELFPLRTALDRRGADVSFVRWRDAAIEVVAARASGDPLWDTVASLRLPSEPTRLDFDVTSVRLDRDRCPDVIVSVAARQGQYVLTLDGGDGSLLWARTLDGPDADASTRRGADRNRAC
ncbi:MAG: hypothetical protein M3271_03860, partial [Actinomycetota bacterium]|nr:hypothetical protein [Actinomycetota bacterium]